MGAGAARGHLSRAVAGAQGFIHLSKRDQVVGTANRYYRDQRDLVLLVVDPAKLDDLRYEAPDGSPESDERFPHLYGALPLDAVIRVVDFPPEPGGDWRSLPAAAASTDS